MRRLALLVGLLIVPFLWLGTEPAAACSCVQSSLADFVERSDAVASGRLVDRTYVRDGMDVVYTFAGSERFKGRSNAGFEVRTSASSASCGVVGLVVGREYVVFMDETGGELTANSCGGTSPATPRYVERVEAVTGPGASFGAMPTGRSMAAVVRLAQALGAALSGSALWG